MQYLRTASLAAFALFLGACASKGGISESPEKYLTKRAEARWTAMISGQWEQAYAYFTPGYREASSLEGYRQSMLGRRVSWTGARVKKVECSDAERCLVGVEVDYSLIGGMPGVANVSSQHYSEETWLRLGGEWYYLPAKQSR